MQLPVTVEVKGIRVLTSKQLAEAYQTTTDTIKTNFNANRSRFVEEKHYIALTGDELKAFKKQVRNPYLVANRASHLYLWTEKGALLHAKSLNTDKAWEVYDYLVDYYFRAEEEQNVPVTVETRPAPVENPKKDELPQMDDPIRMLKVLLKVAEDKGIKVKSCPFPGVFSMLKDNRIGICTGVTIERVCYELAWELSHVFIHHQNGDLINSPLAKDYNDQATRAAEMVIKILNVKIAVSR